MVESVMDLVGNDNRPCREKSAHRKGQNVRKQRFVGRWIPVDKNQLRRQMIMIRLPFQGIDESLRPPQGIAAMIVIARSRDNREIRLRGVSLFRLRVRHNTGFQLAAFLCTRALQKKMSIHAIQVHRTDTEMPLKFTGDPKH